MSNNGKIKVYKNPARSRPDVHKPYVPQYQVMGVEPEEYKSPVAPGYHIAMQKTPSAKDSVRSARPVIRQPYAEAVVSPIGRGKGLLPNVGNNMEQTWSSVDGEIVDDITGVDSDHPMIDNNEFVNPEAMGFTEEPVAEEVTEIGSDAIDQLRNATNEVEKSFLSEDELQNALTSEYLSTLIKQLEEEEYLLLVDNGAICSGPIDYIQEQTRLLVFGEHELYHGNPVSVDDILVIKRVKIKVGVFLE